MFLRVLQQKIWFLKLEYHDVIKFFSRKHISSEYTLEQIATIFENNIYFQIKIIGVALEVQKSLNGVTKLGYMIEMQKRNEN